MQSTTLLAIFTFSFILAIGAVMSPGPVTTAIVSQAPRIGWRVGPLISLGHALLELIIVLALAFGLQQFLALPGIESSISLIGGLLLIWMGSAILDSLRKGKIKLPQQSQKINKQSKNRIVYLGVLATLANPFWYAWWVSVPTAYLAQASALGLLPLAAFYVGHISADFLWNTFLATAISNGSRWFNDRFYAWILGACSLFFVYLGLSFLARAWLLFQSS